MTQPVSCVRLGIVEERYRGVKPKSRLSNSGMRSHLKNCHDKEWTEFLTKEKQHEQAKVTTEELENEADVTEN